MPNVVLAMVGSHLKNHNDLYHIQLVNWRLHQFFNPRLYCIRVAGQQRLQLADDGNVGAVQRLLANNVLDVKKKFYRNTNGHTTVSDMLRVAIEDQDIAMCRALIAAGAKCINTYINRNALALEFGRMLKDHGAIVRDTPTPRGQEFMYDPIYIPWPVVTVFKKVWGSDEVPINCLIVRVLPW
ncbi:hypothetical protein FN846DRAFT_889433 [Sphaerosporella brunnea]|uniref:Ankyrin repeat-containing domain protein n=1 Tax=Sphaerosporella brunnea TaxID=1250544 RepID=A0A5J5EZ73_9PEZI|nr:hypothetical protein FN846DRAFT_889433 [Sphaerosporella brunnea]